MDPYLIARAAQWFGVDPAKNQASLAEALSRPGFADALLSGEGFAQYATEPLPAVSPPATGAPTALASPGPRVQAVPRPAPAAPVNPRAAIPADQYMNPANIPGPYVPISPLGPPSPEWAGPPRSNSEWAGPPTGGAAAGTASAAPLPGSVGAGAGARPPNATASASPKANTTEQAGQLAAEFLKNVFGGLGGMNATNALGGGAEKMASSFNAINPGSPTSMYPDLSARILAALRSGTVPPELAALWAQMTSGLPQLPTAQAWPPARGTYASEPGGRRGL